MAAVTDEDFEYLVDDELAWRRMELAALANQVVSASRANPVSPASRALSRGMATLLYAHWEGYGKAVFDAYLKLVLRRKPLAAEAADGLLAAHMLQLLRRVDSGDSAATDELVHLVRGEASPRLRLAQSRVVDTKSNLRFGALTAIMDVFDMPTANFETKRNLIDVLLCDRRNDIAHGRANFPSSEEILELHGQVIEMMEGIRDLAIRHVRAKAYRIELPSNVDGD